jgi:hypothetical protein
VSSREPDTVDAYALAHHGQGFGGPGGEVDAPFGVGESAGDSGISIIVSSEPARRDDWAGSPIADPVGLVRA